MNANRILSAHNLLRNPEVANHVNDGTRTLVQSVLVPEVRIALKDWASGTPTWNSKVRRALLIGGLAVSYYVRPRATMGIELLFLSADQVPNEVPGFKRIRSHAFRHNLTHVEVEVRGASFLMLPRELHLSLLGTAVNDESGFYVPSPTGLIALKLFRFSRQDQADIEALVNFATKEVVSGEILRFGLPSENLIRLEEFLK